MQVTGIICEYNPLHLGHKKQLDLVRDTMGTDSGIVCLMSGNFVQRGSPAILDKSLRAKAAVACGADLVLELPVTVAVSSAEGFAAGGVALLAPFCQSLCFGAETADSGLLFRTAQALLNQDFSRKLRPELDKGLSFPAARQAALAAMGIDAPPVANPNDILAVEYCKAILSQEAAMQILPIGRQGSYHDPLPDRENPSATAVRHQMLNGGPWQDYVPQAARECFHGAALHTLEAGEGVILARLRCMSETEFAALPYGSEGLWRKFMHACREKATVAQILAEVKSKRYTHTRISRMLLCAVLGLTQGDLSAPVPYARVLAFNEKGRQILKQARQSGLYPNASQPLDHPFQAVEDRCGDLYGLFSTQGPEPPGLEARRRVCAL